MHDKALPKNTNWNYFPMRRIFLIFHFYGNCQWKSISILASCRITVLMAC